MKFIIWTLVWFGLFEIDSLVAILEIKYMGIKIHRITRFVFAWSWIILWIPLYLIFIK